jgi:hypothetical protein
MRCSKQMLIPAQLHLLIDIRLSSTPSLSLDSLSTLTGNGRESVSGIGMGGMGIVREYGDRFVPSKEDLRTNFLSSHGGRRPSTPSKSRIIQSDALKGEHPLSFI